MSNKFFEIFKQPSDHDKWERHIDYISSLIGIEDNLKEKLISSINFLEQELGKKFLKTINYNHPIKQKISNKADWQCHDIIQFVDTLQELKKNDSNYPKLIKKILGYKNATTEGIPFVEIAGNYLKEGCHVYFIEEIQGNRTPDIEIINPENYERFFVEVSTVENSDVSKLITDNYNFLFEMFHLSAPFCYFTGKQKNIISKDDYPVIQKIIFDSKKNVEESLQPVTYCDERIYFTIVPDNKPELLYEICEQNGTEINEISGLPQNYDETYRIINKIESKKAEQIPIGGNGILYFPTNPLYFLATDIDEAIIRFQDCISSFTNLIGIVLYSKVLDNKDEVFIESKKNILSRKITKGVLCRELLFVYNNHCNLKISTETLQKIYDSFK